MQKLKKEISQEPRLFTLFAHTYTCYFLYVVLRAVGLLRHGEAGCPDDVLWWENAAHARLHRNTSRHHGYIRSELPYTHHTAIR